jgi:hypothetical protein
LWDDIRDVCKVVDEHARAEEGLKCLFAGGMVAVIPASTSFEAVFGKSLVIIAQPFGTCRIVRQAR